MTKLEQFGSIFIRLDAILAEFPGYLPGFVDDVRFVPKRQKTVRTAISPQTDCEIARNMRPPELATECT